MINTATKSTGVMNHNSILSINIPEKQSVKNQNNIMTLIKNPRTNSTPTTSGQPQNRAQQTPQYNQPQNRAQQTPQYNQPQNRTQQTPQYNQPQNRTQQTPQYNQPQNRTQQALQNRPPRQSQNIQPALTAGQQNTASTPGVPAAKPIPMLYNKVQKGQKTLLSTSVLTTINACFGWNVTDARCDVDVSAFLLGAN